MNKGLKTSQLPVIADREQHFSDVQLTDTELHQLLVDWNNTQVKYPLDRCIHQLFVEQVAKSPNAVAAICKDKQLTYWELNCRANQLAHYLKRFNVRSEVLVGICLERSLLTLVSLLGILKAGGAYVPLDPAYPTERLAFIVQDSKVPVLLTKQYLVNRFSNIETHIVCLDSDWKEITQESKENPTIETTADCLAYVIYTSGTTGTPKGVLGLHQGAVNRFHWMWEVYPFEVGERCCQKTSLSFVDSVWEIFGPLLQGIPIAIVPDEVVKDTKQLVQTLATNQITRIVLVPSLLRAILDCATDLPDQLYHLKYCFTSGEAISLALSQRFQTIMPQSILINLYGSSEVSADVTSYDTRANSSVTSVPIGRPIANTQIYILDSHLQPVPVGVTGELCVSSVGLARGYLNRPDLTAEKFITNPFSQNQDVRMYKTGDLARYLTNGDIEFLGRLDHQVKIRGFRVELGEIEAILNQHPAVEESVVITHEDKPDNKYLTAYIVANPQYQKVEQQVTGTQWDDIHTSQWQKVWDEIYSQSQAHQDPTFNTIGWNSSYTRLPIAAEEMHEWVDDAVEQILSLQPSFVLEIGCGTGLLLFQIAPHCTSYWGTDFSPVALNYVRQQLNQLDRPLSNITLLQKTAEDFEAIEPGSFDAVILNSIVQHFPSIDYFLQVLEGAVNVVAPGGFIFVGDVRSLPLLEAFHTSVLLDESPATLPTAQLRQRVQKRMMQEEELIIDPALFTALKEHFPQISHVEIRPKRGRYHNELTRFRYQAVIHIGVKQSLSVNPTWLDWHHQSLNLSTVRQMLLKTQPEVLGITRVPNARLLQEIKTVELLASSNAPATVRDLRQALQKISPESGIDPEDLWPFSQDLPYIVNIDWSSSSTDGCYNVILRRYKLTRTEQLKEEISTPQQPTSSCKPWKTYVNNPLQGKFTRELVPQLRSFLHQKLPEYMVPVTFVLLDSLPLTPNGKVDRSLLPVPSKTRPELEAVFVAPSNSTEEVLANIWAEVLGLEQVGIHDNFFDLGGHSLLAAQIISRISEAFKVEISLRQLFAAPTIASLAKSLKSAHREQVNLPPIVPISRNSDLPLSFGQQQLWFFNQFAPNNPSFNVPIAVRFTGWLNLEVLEQCLKEIIRRHEILRTTLTEVNGQPIQVILPDVDFSLTRIELQQLPAAEREAEAQRLNAEELQQPFNIIQSLLFRGTLLCLSEQEHILLWTMHTLICDGWSIRVFIQELTTLYAAFCKGQPSPLPELAIQYADFAAWQRQWLQGEILDRHLAYWQQQLGGSLTVLQLPTDSSRQPMQRYRSAMQTLDLSPNLSVALQLLNRREGVTMFMFLLAVFQTLLYRYTGQEDILVGAPSANRNRLELEAPIGFLGNGIVLRTNLSGNPTFRELLDRVRETVLDAHAHQNLPFGKLMEIQHQQQIPPMPPFQVMFNLLNLGDRQIQLPGVRAEVASPPAGLMCEVDLILWVVEHNDSIQPALIYNAELFETATVKRMLTHLHTLLKNVVLNPQQHISDLPLD
ncbi:hypothetical protein WA1_00900 [Scytonema hofmannii PCC 7110]|uniref:Carrier domain-containing protein n=1 Tax=Scytonema hofmannii PCC 7110 TaxID=128403 RepID=A0A139XGC9_9CYAN|nr:non-ribosomal peptide synthetase [Scytonema hofmannii]KYC43755.1 hypothetical protein WA1_00900 [Scytonema hofmannii PCC 7110]